MQLALKYVLFEMFVINSFLSNTQQKDMDLLRSIYLYIMKVDLPF